MESTREPGSLDTDAILVRTMEEADLASVVAIDAQATRRERPDYFGLMLKRSLKETNLQISLIAEFEKRAVGFLIGSLYYGEFGMVEPSATIDAIGVDRDVRGRHVGKALMRQFRLNLGALRISTIRTEVSWDDFELLAFFKSEGFEPSKRICLEMGVDPTLPGD